MDSSRLPPRVLLVLLVASGLVAAAALVAGLVTGGVTGGVAHDRRPATEGTPAAEGRVPRAAAVLRAWDDRRARAWARGDVAGLRALYVPGSRAGRHDVRMLRAWRQRGLRVRGMRMQVLDLRVLPSAPGRLELLVTDRLAHATALGARVGGPATVRLPRDAASTRTIALERRHATWQVVAVRDRAQPAR